MRREKLICAPGQSIYDAVLEAYGSLDGLDMLLEDNTFVIPNAPDTDGIRLHVRDTYRDRENVFSIFSKRKPISR